MNSLLDRRLFFSLFLSLFIIATSSCQSSKKQFSPADAKNAETPSMGAAATVVAPLGTPVTMANGTTAKPLTTSGEDTDPRFSNDGERILFVSRLRPSHKQAQVYEMHLGAMKEKRLTFHDGDDSSPSYTPDGQRFLFASATDEIKEEPFVSERMMKTFLPDAYEARVKQKGGAAIEGIEIYVQTLNGRSIERLSKSAGFDGDPDMDAKGRRILFSSARDAGFTHLYMLNGKNVSRLTNGKVVDRGPKFSPDAKFIIWSRQVAEPKTTDSQILLATSDMKKPLELTSGNATNFEPAWNPAGDEIIFSSNRDGKFFNLYVVDRAGTCVRRVTEAPFDQFQPAFSPDGKRLLFTGRQDSHRHIYIMNYQKPAPCPPAAPVSTPAPAPAAAAPTPLPAATP